MFNTNPLGGTSSEVCLNWASCLYIWDVSGNLIKYRQPDDGPMSRQPERRGNMLEILEQTGGYVLLSQTLLPI